jgi:glutaredoxin-like protein NrdH
MNTVTVYTLPECPNCHRTIQFLDRADIPHTVEAIEQTGSSRDLITRLGHRQAPVVTVSSPEGTLLDHWSGLRPDRIITLAHPALGH